MHSRNEASLINHLNTHDLIAHLRGAGLRVTPQRLAVYEALASTPDHPTVQELFDRLQAAFPALSQATVYNTLEVMVDMGVARELHTAGDGAVRYDANITPHAHLVCTDCNRVEDLPEVLLNLPRPEDISGAGYRIQAVGVFYYGKCPACQAASAGQGRAGNAEANR
jgi:Fur family transcriptional regulator, peroxide stress response regulator